MSFTIPPTLHFGSFEGEKRITACRSISATDEIWDFVCVIPVCMVTGEKAGVADSMTDESTVMP